MPQTPLKKKRPPRKKKKKIEQLQHQSTLESCKEQNPEEAIADERDQTNYNKELDSTVAITMKQSEYDSNETLQKSTHVTELHDSGISLEQDKNDEKTKVINSFGEKKQTRGVSKSEKFPSKKHDENVWHTVSKAPVPLRSPSKNSHKQHYSLNNNPYNVGGSKGSRPKIYVSKPNEPRQNIHRPSVNSWAAHAASVKKSNIAMPSSTKTHYNFNHASPKTATQNQVTGSKSGYKEIPYDTSSSRQSNSLPVVDGRPRIAVQKAFWPSLGESHTNSSQVSGAINQTKSVQTKKKIPTNNAWSKKR